MYTYIVLLRGVNVGGKNKLPMRALKSSLENKGVEDVQTYIQSGNVVCRSVLSKDELKALFLDLLKNEFALTVPVLVLPMSDFEAVYSNNPFVGKYEVNNLHVSIFDAKAKITNFEPDGDNAIKLSDRAAYLVCPKGYSKTKYNNNFLEKKLEVNATTRNWRTMLALNKLCNE